MSGILHAADVKSGASTLLLGGSARAIAMRGAYTAAAGDVDSIFYNPGGLAAIGRSQVSLTHAELLLGVDYDVVEYAHPTRVGTWGVSLARLGIGTIETRDADRRPTGGTSAEDLVGSLAFSKDYHASIGAGVNIKFIRSRIASDEASTVALDVGTVVRWPERPLWFGASVLNMGSGLRFIEETSALPLTCAVGAAAKIANTVNVTIDLKRNVHDRESNWVSGIEYFLLPTASLRAGYGTLLSHADAGGAELLQNLQGGLGLTLSRYQLDYAISSPSDTSAFHRITLSTVF